MNGGEVNQAPALLPKVTLAPSLIDSKRQQPPSVTEGYGLDVEQAKALPKETLRKGGGIADISCHVSADSFVDAHSIILNQSSTINSSLLNSKAQASVLINSSLNSSRLVSSHVVNSRVLGSTLLASVAADALISNSTLKDVVIAGLFGQSPEVDGVKLADCTIEGGAKLIGPWEVSGPVRIHEGEWYRAPRWKRISSKESEHFAVLTECVNGRALIACRCHDMRRWQRSGPRLGRFLGWPAAMVQEAYLTFEEWLDTNLTDSVVSARARLNPPTHTR